MHKIFKGKGFQGDIGYHLFVWPKCIEHKSCAKHGSGLCAYNQLSSVQSLSCVRLFVTPWTAARQTSLSITNSQRLLKLMSIELVTASYHLILCRPLLLPPSIFPSMRCDQHIRGKDAATPHLVLPTESKLDSVIPSSSLVTLPILHDPQHNCSRWSQPT